MLVNNGLMAAFKTLHVSLCSPNSSPERLTFPARRQLTGDLGSLCTTSLQTPKDKLHGLFSCCGGSFSFSFPRGTKWPKGTTQRVEGRVILSGSSSHTLWVIVTLWHCIFPHRERAPCRLQEFCACVKGDNTHEEA